MANETKNLKLFKWDTGSQTDLESRFDINKSLNENWDKTDEAIGQIKTDITDLQENKIDKEEGKGLSTNDYTDEEKEKLSELENYDDTEVKIVINALIAENTSLKNQIPCGQAEGESITIDDSSDLPIKKIEIGGKMEQETSTTGKNYFTGNKIKDGTTNGITYSFNNSILKLNGTVTTLGNIINDAPTKVKLPAGTYTYTIKQNSGTFERPSGDFAFYLMKSPNTFITGNYANSGITGSQLMDAIHSMTFTTEEDTDLYLRFYSSNKDIVFNNLELYIQIESGSNYTEFEQFIPNMPSIDYPSPIKCVKGENEVKVQNKNFIYVRKNTSVTKSGITVSTDENGIITINGTLDEIVYLKLYSDLELLTVSELLNNGGFENKEKKKFQNGIYNIGFKYINGKKTGANSSINFRDELRNANVNYSLDNFMYMNIDKTFEIEDGEYVIYAWLDKGIIFDNYSFAIQIEEVEDISSTSTEYVSHEEQNYPLSLGDIEVYEDGYISIDYTEKAGYKTVTKASVYNEWSKHIMDGVTNKFKSKHGSLYTDTNGFYSLVIENKMKNVTYDKIKCNYLKSFNGGSFSAYKTTCLWNESNTNSMFASIPFLTLTDANKWLQELNTAGTPFEIVYPLETPTVTEITDETLLAQLESLINAETYRYVTHIDTETENLKPNLKLTYRKDLETMFENINNSILSLGGNI